MVLKGKAGDGLVTPEEARAAGLSFDDPPEPKCRFCGRGLEPLGAVLLGQVRWVSHEACGCEGELAEQAEREREHREREEAEAEMARRIAASGIKRRFRNAQTSIPAVACQMTAVLFPTGRKVIAPRVIYGRAALSGTSP